MSQQIKDGGPAFPTGTQASQNSATGETTMHQYLSDGISARDYFAAKALQGFCANPAIFATNSTFGWGLVNCTEEQLCQVAYGTADSMLKVRSFETRDALAVDRVLQQRDDLIRALIDLDARFRECSGKPISAAEAYDSFYQEIVAEALARVTGD